MKKMLIGLSIFLTTALFASGDLDLTFGDKGHVYLNETTGLELGSWILSKGVYGSLSLATLVSTRGVQTLHSYKLSDSGARYGIFGKNAPTDLCQYGG